MKCGVYFLLNRKKIVYVGATKRFPVRFNMTNSKFVFDRIRFIKCRKKDLFLYEKRWIKKFNPKYNYNHKDGCKFGMTGRLNPSAGNKLGNSKLNNLPIGEFIKWTKKYHPSIAIKTYKGDGNLEFKKIDREYFIRRISL